MRCFSFRCFFITNLQWTVAVICKQDHISVTLSATLLSLDIKHGSWDGASGRDSKSIFGALHFVMPFYFCPHTLFSLSLSWSNKKPGTLTWAKNLHITLLQRCLLCWIKCFSDNTYLLFPSWVSAGWCLVSEAWQRICILWHFTVCSMWGMGRVVTGTCH